VWILSKVKQVVAVHWRDIHFHEAWQEYNIIKQEIPVFVTYGVKLKGGVIHLLLLVVYRQQGKRIIALET
jgi:hypothetical protein